MPPHAFRIGPSSLALILQASVGMEGNGMEPSVLSALARLGRDPRAEAARLANLSQPAAVDRLAGVILSLFGSGWPVAEVAAAASRPVKLLPAHTRSDGLASQPLSQSCSAVGGRSWFRSASPPVRQWCLRYSSALHRAYPVHLSLSRLQLCRQRTRGNVPQQEKTGLGSC